MYPDGVAFLYFFETFTTDGFINYTRNDFAQVRKGFLKNVLKKSHKMLFVR